MLPTGDQSQILVNRNGTNYYINLPQQMVVPQHMTLELFNFLNLGETEIGDVGCHEAVHGSHVNSSLRF